MTISDSVQSLEFVDPHPRELRVRTSIQHWQLRDLLVFPDSKENKIYHVFHSSVNAINVANHNVHAVMRDLNFQPTCLTAAEGYLAVGGQRSQIVVKGLESEWMASTSVGGAINNCVYISKHDRDIRLYICNNDETIKIFNVPQMDHWDTIKLNTAVNGVSISPDGRKMVAVGDSNHVFIFNINSAGRYEKVATLSTTKDAGFSCCWDHSSTKFAIGCQDGAVCVWDIRNSKKLFQIPSTQTTGRGAVRSVKFSHSSSVDLLAFSEHTSYFNVIDARTFDHRDSIRLANESSDPNVTGLAFSPDSKSIFVGVENCIYEYDIDTRRRRGFPSGGIM